MSYFDKEQQNYYLRMLMAIASQTVNGLSWDLCTDPSEFLLTAEVSSVRLRLRMWRMTGRTELAVETEDRCHILHVEMLDECGRSKLHEIWHLAYPKMNPTDALQVTSVLEDLEVLMCPDLPGFGKNHIIVAGDTPE